MVRMYEKSIGSYVKSIGIILYFVYKVMIDFKLRTEVPICYIVIYIYCDIRVCLTIDGKDVRKIDWILC